MKTRKTEKIPNHPGIYRVLVLDPKTGRWVEPERGNAFYASRSFPSADGGTRKVKRYFDSFAEARAFRTGANPGSTEKAVAPAVAETAARKAGMTFFELAERWRRDWLPHKAISTQVRYRSYLQHFEYFRNLPVEQIEPTDIDAWLASIKNPEYLKQFHSTRCDYSHEFSVLRRILNFYASRFNRNYRPPFISEHRRMLKVKEKPKIEKDLNVEEFKLFIQTLHSMVAGTRFELIYYVALMQYGVYCRVQEVAALHCEDFNLSRNEVTLNKKVIWPRAKGYEPFLESGAKTDGGKKIPLSALAKQALQEWMLKSGIRTGLLFQLDGKLLTYRQIEHLYTQALKKAGLPYSATHVLRHASLTEFYDTCKDLLQTQRVAGQRDLRSTTRYTKVRDERVVQTQLAMDRKLSSLFE